MSANFATHFVPDKELVSSSFEHAENVKNIAVSNSVILKNFFIKLVSFMVNTRNKSPSISAITTHCKYTRKRRLSPIRLLGSPQATIHYGEVYAYKVSTHPICIGSFIARFISEVVIQKAIELFYMSLLRLEKSNLIRIFGANITNSLKFIIINVNFLNINVNKV